MDRRVLQGASGLCMPGWAGLGWLDREQKKTRAAGWVGASEPQGVFETSRLYVLTVGMAWHGGRGEGVRFLLLSHAAWFSPHHSPIYSFLAELMHSLGQPRSTTAASSSSSPSSPPRRRHAQGLRGGGDRTWLRSLDTPGRPHKDPANRSEPRSSRLRAYLGITVSMSQTNSDAVSVFQPCAEGTDHDLGPLARL